MEITVTPSESKNEMLVMVVTDLAAICQKLAENSAVPEDLRVQARRFGEEFNSLLPYRGKGDVVKHERGERLLTKKSPILTASMRIEPAVIPREGTDRIQPFAVVRS